MEREAGATTPTGTDRRIAPTSILRFCNGPSDPTGGPQVKSTAVYFLSPRRSNGTRISGGDISDGTHRRFFQNIFPGIFSGPVSVVRVLLKLLPADRIYLPPRRGYGGAL
jgi:hypothetical protein